MCGGQNNGPPKMLTSESLEYMNMLGSHGEKN